MQSELCSALGGDICGPIAGDRSLLLKHLSGQEGAQAGCEVEKLRLNIGHLHVKSLLFCIY